MIMKVTGLILKDNNRYIHDSVYKPATTGECASLLTDDDSWPYKYVTMGLGNRYIAQGAARIAFIHYRTRAMLAAVINLLSDEPPYDNRQVKFLRDIEVTARRPGNLTNALRGRCLYLLFHMFACTPNQGFGNNLNVRDITKSCDQYRLCPWCRYKKAHQLFNSILPLLAEDREVCVTHFMSPCKSVDIDLNSSEEAYEKVTRSIRDQRDWIGDYLITLPYHAFPTASKDGEPDLYRLVWRTSLIAVAKRDAWLKPPENLSPKKIDGATFLSDGVVYRYPAHIEGLRDAFSLVMGYPKWMMSTKLTDELLADILTVLLAGDRNRAVPHGLRETEPTEPTAAQTASGQG
jgi:hypothetical protein